MELSAGLPEANRLRSTSGTADYLLTYGTNQTKLKTRRLIGRDEQRDRHNGYNSLHRAARYGESLEALRLIRTGADVEAYTSTGECALHLAAKHNQVDIILALCDPTPPIAPLDQKNKKGDKEAIHYAAEKGCDEAARGLLQYGACPSPKPEHFTPLHLAAMNNHGKMIRQLTDFGASPNELAFYGMTALHYAAEFGCTDVVTQLLDYHKVDPDVRTCLFLSPLCLAIEKNHLAIAMKLVECNADPFLA